MAERESTDGGQFVLLLFTISRRLKPALLNVHTDGHMCVFVHMHTRGLVKLLNTLYIFILGDESGASS